MVGAKKAGRRSQAISPLLLGAVLLAGLPGLVHARQEASPLASPVAAGLPWWQDAVCYEIFVRSFADSDGDGIGDLRGLIAKLDYLNDGDPASTGDLGVTCLWLMPIAQSPSYHGYDVVDFETIEQDYGTNADFKTFVAEANRRGIRVLIDLVLNHVSIEHPWFQAALADPAAPERGRFIFSDTDPGYPGSYGQDVWHPTPDGSAYYYGTFGAHMPDLNYADPAVTEEAYRIARFWIEEMGVDGFRLDAIKHLIEEGEVQEDSDATHRWLRDFRAYLDSFAPDAYTVGELFNEGSVAMLPYYPNQLHAYFQFEIGPQILQAASFGAGSGIVAITEAADAAIPDQRWAPFLTNHDQARAMNALNGDVARAKVAATALLTAPGLPFLYYGEEIGMSGTKPDERIRTPMQWTADPAGFTSGMPWQPFQDDLATVNVATQDDDPDSLLNHYRRLIRLHVGSPALAHGAFIPLDARSALAAYLRVAPEQTVLVVINFDDEPRDGMALAAEVATGLPPGEYEVVPLLGEEPGAPLVVDPDGRFADYAPLPTLAPLTGDVFAVVPAG